MLEKVGVFFLGIGLLFFLCFSLFLPLFSSLVFLVPSLFPNFSWACVLSLVLLSSM